MEHKGFWDSLDEQGILDEYNVVLGGDLNLIFSRREVWGNFSRLESLS